MLTRSPADRSPRQAPLKPMKIALEILRQQADHAPKAQTFVLEDVAEGTTILDCLNRVKWELDGSLAFRKNCRNTICGSCGMRINGRSALACKENVGETLAKFPPRTVNGLPAIAIAPLGNLPVVKDLVVDMAPFWRDLRAVDPFVSAAARQDPTGDREAAAETLQLPEERAKLAAAGNCILCGACYSECNAKEANPNFVGPHALAKAQRLVDETRDTATAARLERYGTTDGVWGCTRCYYCNDVCPMEVAPLDRIRDIKSAILARTPDSPAASRAVRHRKTLVQTVREGGWVDERKFALRVMGNGFRDLGAIAALGPLGLRMLTRGKLPLTFEPSAGTDQVRDLIDAVRSREAQSHHGEDPA